MRSSTNGKRTCGNCCFCKSETVYSACGVCVMSKKREMVMKGDTAEERNCKHHLFKEEKKEIEPTGD